MSTIGMDQFGRLPVRRVGDVDEPIEGAFETRAHCASIFRATAEAENLDPPPVVAFDEFGDQSGHRMLPEVCGEVAEADPPTWPRLLAQRHRGFGYGNFGGDPASAGELLLGCR